jgi:Fe2+ or Zn2+ uptake regulation protein
MLENTQQAADAVVRSVEERLAQEGFRVTGARRAIIGVMAQFEHPFTTGELESAVSQAGLGVGRASIYRTLALLESQGLVEKLHQAGAEHYTLCLRSEHHHHVTCIRCGKTEDFLLQDRVDIVAAVERLTRDLGYLPESHVLEVYGTCPACQTDPPSPGSRGAHPPHRPGRPDQPAIHHSLEGTS